MTDGSLTLGEVDTLGAEATPAADHPRAEHAAGGAHAGAPSAWPFLVPVAILVMVFGLAMLEPVLLVGGLAVLLIPIVGWFRDANRELAATQSGVGHGSPEPDPEGAVDPSSLARSSFPGPAFGLAVALVIVAVGVTLSLNVKGSTAAASEGGGSTATVADGKVAVDAQNIQFTVAEIDAPANQAFEIAFRNEDTVPHNIAILDSSAGAKTFFRGDVVTGPASATYEVPALAAGTYYFHCDVHPGMNGTVSVK
jgi:plastocyanin